MKCFYKIGQHILATDPAVNSKKVIGIPPGTRYYIDFSKGNYETYMFQHKMLGNYLILFKYYYENLEDTVSSKKPIGVVLMDLAAGRTYHMDFVLASKHKFEAAFLPLDDYMILVVTSCNYDAGKRSVNSFYHFVHIYYNGNLKLSFSIEHIVDSPYRLDVYNRYNEQSPAFIVLSLLYNQILVSGIEGINREWITAQTIQITMDLALNRDNTELFVIGSDDFRGEQRIQRTNLRKPRNLVYLDEKTQNYNVVLFYISEEDNTVIRFIAGLTGYIYNMELRKISRYVSIPSDTGISNYRLPGIQMKQENCLVINDSDFNYYMLTYDYKHIIEIFGDSCNVSLYRLQDGGLFVHEHASRCIQTALNELEDVTFKKVVKITQLDILSNKLIVLKVDTERLAGPSLGVRDARVFYTYYILLQFNEKTCDFYICQDMKIYYKDKAIIGKGVINSSHLSLFLDLKTGQSFKLKGKYVLYDEKERVISSFHYFDQKIVMKIHRILDNNDTIKLIDKKIYHMPEINGIETLETTTKFLTVYSDDMIAFFSPLGLVCQLYFTLYLRLDNKKGFKQAVIDGMKRKYFGELTNVTLILNALIPIPQSKDTYERPLKIMLSNLDDEINVIAGIPIDKADNMLITDSVLKTIVKKQKDKVYNVDLLLDLIKPDSEVAANLLIYDFTTQRYCKRIVELKSTMLFFR